MLRNMRIERLTRDLSLQEVADELGVHVNAVGRWENGKTDPSSQNLAALCKLYDCSPEYLLDMTDERKGTAVAD